MLDLLLVSLQIKYKGIFIYFKTLDEATNFISTKEFKKLCGEMGFKYLIEIESKYRDIYDAKNKLIFHNNELISFKQFIDDYLIALPNLEAAHLISIGQLMKINGINSLQASNEPDLEKRIKENLKTEFEHYLPIYIGSSGLKNVIPQFSLVESEEDESEED